MKRMAALLAGAALMMATSSAMATVVNSSGGGNGSELNMQQILNSITLGNISNVNAFTDFIKDPNDSLWTTGGVGISSATMILELAGRANTDTFGIYDSSNIANKAQLFDGPSGAGSKVALTFGTFLTHPGMNLRIQDMSGDNPAVYTHFDSTTFGFYFGTKLPDYTFYSDTTQNADHYDHMVAYGSNGGKVKLPGNPNFTDWMQNEFVLGFENTLGGGDHDYNDMVLMVESVAPVPEPGTMMLLGAGFLGLAIYGKRRKNA